VVSAGFVCVPPPVVPPVVPSVPPVTPAYAASIRLTKSSRYCLSPILVKSNPVACGCMLFTASPFALSYTTTGVIVPIVVPLYSTSTSLSSISPYTRRTPSAASATVQYALTNR
jgi:hypothetical protein